LNQDDLKLVPIRLYRLDSVFGNNRATISLCLLAIQMPTPEVKPKGLSIRYNPQAILVFPTASILVSLASPLSIWRHHGHKDVTLGKLAAIFTGLPPNEASIYDSFPVRGSPALKMQELSQFLSSFNRWQGSALANSGLPPPCSQALKSLQSERPRPFNLATLMTFDRPFSFIPFHRDGPLV
jgi:hypothetical protein